MFFEFFFWTRCILKYENLFVLDVHNIVVQQLNSIPA